MQIKSNLRKIKRVARHERIRKNLVGTKDRPRLCVSRSLNNIAAQIVDDTTHKVLLGVSSLNKDLRKKLKSGGNLEAATAVGEAVALLAQKKGIKKVAFDRGGYLYHGRIKAVAEAARKAGLEF
jgi:large subunit ribosomal protein L18